jgi:hypothetical protein
VLVRLDDGGSFLLKSSLLEPQPDGSYRMALSFDELAAKAALDESEVIIPVVEEVVTVEKREVERGRFRITKSVSERDVLVDQPLFQEHVEVEREEVHAPQHVTLRREDVTIDPLSDDADANGNAPEPPA